MAGGRCDHLSHRLIPTCIGHYVASQPRRLLDWNIQIIPDRATLSLHHPKLQGQSQMAWLPRTRGVVTAAANCRGSEAVVSSVYHDSHRQAGLASLVPSNRHVSILFWVILRSHLVAIADRPLSSDPQIRTPCAHYQRLRVSTDMLQN